MYLDDTLVKKVFPLILFEFATFYFFTIMCGLASSLKNLSKAFHKQHLLTPRDLQDKMTGPSETLLLHEVYYKTLQVKHQIGSRFHSVNSANWQINKLFCTHCPGKLDNLVNLKEIKTSN